MSLGTEITLISPGAGATWSRCGFPQEVAARGAEAAPLLIGSEFPAPGRRGVGVGLSHSLSL